MWGHLLHACALAYARALNQELARGASCQASRPATPHQILIYKLSQKLVSHRKPHSSTL